MNKKFKTILIILLIVAIISIVVYFVLKNNNKDENSYSENSDAEEIPVDTTNSGNSGSIGFFEKPNSHLYPIHKGVYNNSEVKLFQKGLIRAFGSDSLEGGADGDWGPNTEKLVTSKLSVNVFKERGAWVALLNKVKGVPLNFKTIGKYRTHYLFPKA